MRRSHLEHEGAGIGPRLFMAQATEPLPEMQTARLVMTQPGRLGGGASRTKEGARIINTLPISASGANTQKWVVNDCMKFKRKRHA
jgi:hypothetical protein